MKIASSLSIKDLRSGRVKLIFGDPEQIRILEAERKIQEEEEADEKDKKAGRHILHDYTFLIEGTYSFEKTIRAYNQAEAEEEISSFGPEITDDVEYDCDHKELIGTRRVEDGIEREAGYD